MSGVPEGRYHQYDVLREALLGSGTHPQEMLRRYRDNPDFHFGIDTLAKVLPLFVESLAKHADEQAEAREQAMRLMASTPPMPVFFKDES